jgi:protein O-mannosyl-transferase
MRSVQAGWKISQIAHVRPRPIGNRGPLLLAGVLTATAIVYLRCLSGGFIADDKPLIAFNPAISQWSFLWKSLTRNEYWFTDPTNRAPWARYRPLMLVWLGLNYHLFGLNPAGWHAADVMLHLLGVGLVFKIASRLAGGAEAGLLAALLFGVLPGHAEAVAWEASAGVPLSAVLTLAAFLLYLRGANGDRRSRLLAPIGFFAAMMSHEIAIALPELIALHSILFEPATETASHSLNARAWRAIVSAGPFLAVLPFYFALRAYALGSLFSAGRFPVNEATAAQVVMTIPSVVTAYLSGIVTPLPRFYGRRVFFVLSPASPHFYLPLAALIALGGALMFAIKRHPRRRLYLFCAGWTLIALGPLLDLFVLPGDGLVPDAYEYLASFGWCLFVGDWLTAGDRTPRLRAAGRAAGLALAAACAVALWKNQSTFHDDFTLFTRCTDDLPESYHCHDQLASLLRERGDLAGAESQFEVSLRYHPLEPPWLYEKGILDARLGRNRQAEQELESALNMLQQAGPPPAAGYVALAELYDADGDLAHSEAVLDRARSLPDGAQAVQMARARLTMRHGDPAGAEKILDELTVNYPHDYQVWTMLGLLMWAQNRYPDAAAAFAHAVALAPGDARPYYFAARALHRLARDPEALEQCRRALAIDPGNAEARQLSDEIVQSKSP